MIALNFGFGALEAEFWRLVFVMTRIGAVMLAAPIFGAGSVPAQVRVIVTGALAVFVCVWFPAVQPPANLLSLAGMIAIAAEVLIGLALGFVFQIAFAAPIIAAEVISGAMGMSMATAVDPNSGAQSPALGQYFTVAMTLVFLAMGAHLQMIALIAESYASFPPGQAWLGKSGIETVLDFGGAMFAAAVAIALPVTLVLLLAQVVTGVVSRSAPSLNLFALGLPLGVLVGIAALIASAPMMSEMFVDLTLASVDAARQVIAR
jgi:flagellar biosynthetic protein FliR